MTRRASFSQADMQRALRAAKATGYQLSEVSITPGGEIRLKCAPNHPDATPADITEELERHFRAKS